jgi:hypothetical protein
MKISRYTNAAVSAIPFPTQQEDTPVCLNNTQCHVFTLELTN